MIHHIHITKAGKEALIEVNDAEFSDAIHIHLIAEGLKVCLNAKMSGDKVGAVTKLTGEALAKAHAAALRIANENLTALREEKYKFSGSKSKSTTAPREVLNEAISAARNVIRDQLRAHGITLSHVPPKDITAAAKALVEQNPSFLAKAEEAIAARKLIPTETIDLEALGIRPDPAKVAHAAATKEANKSRLATMSAAKAGKVKARSKPKADASAVIAATLQATNPAPHVTAH